MTKPLIIPVFIPHAGCPHHCAFCDQTAITDTRPSIPDSRRIQEIVESYLTYKGNRNRVALAFFGGNFLGLSSPVIIALLKIAGKLCDDRKIDTIRFSTRPDTINSQTLELIKPYPVSTVEIGAQSMNDTVLEHSLRGHTAQDTEKAVSLLRKSGLEVGLQMMVGLMGDTPEIAIESARRIVELSPDFVRIYPLVILKSSLMARWFHEKKYMPLSLEKSVSLVKEIYKIFHQENIPVIRMGLQSSDLLESSSNIVAGPWHPAFGHLVLSEVYFDKACDLIDCLPAKNREITLKVHPSSISRMRGNKNENIKKLRLRYPESVVVIQPDPAMGPEEIALEEARL